MISIYPLHSLPYVYLPIDNSTLVLRTRPTYMIDENDLES